MALGHFMIHGAGLAAHLSKGARSLARELGVGALVTTGVARTIGEDLVRTEAVTARLVLCALLGAIAWNLITWWAGLPSSSTYALLGGLIGAAWVTSGSSAIPETVSTI